jgi:hypothetical protein
MKAHILRYIIILVMLSAAVAAGEIFNDEVKDNVIFKVNNIDHIARYYPSAEKASILAGTDRVLVELGDCRELNNLKYCLDSATEGFDDETGDAASTMEIRVLESGPELDIDLEVSDDEPNLNEVVDITATITNVGNERASNLVFEHNFPSSVKVSGAYLSYTTNGAEWTGSLNSGDSKEISYKITFKDFLKIDSAAKTSVIYNNKVRKASSETVTFDVQKPFNVSDSLSAKSVDVNEEIRYSISIGNNDETNAITIKELEVSIPQGAVISHRDLEFENVNGKVSYSGQISAGQSINLSFKFKASQPVQGDLKAKVQITMGTKTFDTELSHKVGLGVSDIMPEITFKPSPVKGGHELEIEAKITNNGEENISEISLDMVSNLVGNKGWRHLELLPGKKHYAYNKIMNAPSYDEEKEYFIILTGSYLTSAGKIKKFTSRENITVLPQDKLAELAPEIKVDGKEVNVTLKIKNIAAYKLTYVSLIDTFPQGFRMSEGSRDKDFEEIAIGDELTAYSYIVKVPDTYTKDSFEITHIFNGLTDDNQTVMTEKKTKVNLGKAAETGSKSTGTAVNATTNETGNKTDETAAADETEEDDKPGIFTRMWRWIKGLFSGDDEPDDKLE